MCADNVFGGANEGLFVHRVGIVIDVAGQKGRANRVPINPVAIGLCRGGMSRVKVLVHGLYRIHPDGPRKNIVQRNDQVGFRNGRFQVDGGDLAKRVNPGVGASGALRQHLLAGKALDTFGQSALHGRQPGLDLPAVKFRSVIGQRYF